MNVTASLTGLDICGVHARVEVTSWEEAVERSGDVLVRARVCEPGYVAAMRQAVDELGPYVVVAPGVAMPHARPENGVLRPGIAILTLTQPVEFGNPANDPVDLVIPFAAVDKTAHLNTLQRIVALLQDDETLARVRAASTDQQLRTVLGVDP